MQAKPGFQARGGPATPHGRARNGDARAGLPARASPPLTLRLSAVAATRAHSDVVSASTLRLRTLLAGLARLLARLAVLIHVLAALAGLLLTWLVAILRAFLRLLLLGLLLLVGLIRVCHCKSPSRRNHSATQGVATGVPKPGPARAGNAARIGPAVAAPVISGCEG